MEFNLPYLKILNSYKVENYWPMDEHKYTILFYYKHVSSINLQLVFN